MADYRAYDQLREKCHEHRKLEERAVFALTPVSVDDVGNYLERIERYADRQHYIPEDIVRPEYIVHIAQEKIQIFEIEKQAKVFQYRQCKQHFRQCRSAAVFPDKPDYEIIENHCSGQQGQEQDVPPGIEKEGCGNEPYFCRPVTRKSLQQEVCRENYR